MLVSEQIALFSYRLRGEKVASTTVSDQQVLGVVSSKERQAFKMNSKKTMRSKVTGFAKGTKRQ
jgi:hypothetical protein